MSDPVQLPSPRLSWCCNPFCFGLILVLLLSASLLFAPHAFFPIAEEGLWGIRVAAVVLGVLGVRLCVAGVVWFSMKEGQRRIHQALHGGPRVEVLVAFSWGGGLALRLLNEKVWQGPTILLCPTYKAMARICCRPFQLSNFPPNVHVFHALHDMYCPDSQALELERAGCIVHRCEDDHLLMCRTSLVAIARCLRDFLDEANQT